MKELKILGIVVAFTLILYWGVEPLAHSQMHKHVEFENLEYKDLKPVTAKGNAEQGKVKAAMCAACHSIKAAGMNAPMDAMASSAAYGVNPPDLSLAGALLDEKFFVRFLLDPAGVTKSKHFSMPPSATSEQDAADIVAYLKSIAPKEVTPKEAYVFACGRCHANRYDKWTQLGDEPKTKPNIKTGQDIEKLKFQQKLAAYQNKLADYMGKLPPDLSIIWRARSENFLQTFLEDPQSRLPGTAMPRVGLNHKGLESVMAYLEQTGDPSRPEREAIGPWVLGFLVILAVLAYLWKKEVWRDH